MGIRKDFGLAPVHAHINVPGWASLALVGTIHPLYPAAGATRLARAHFRLHNLAPPVLMVSLALLLTGREAADAAVGISSVAMVAALFTFAANAFLDLKPATP